MSIPWYYMWSDTYKFFHELFKDSMKESEFQVHPIYIPQERFDAELYKSSIHFWYGSFIKVDTILECLEAAKEPYIVFSDIDIVVQGSVHDMIKPYMEKGVDMVYMKEGETANIGFMLLRVCPEVIGFWKRVKESMLQSMDLDQNYVNILLKTYDGSAEYFPSELCLNSNYHDAEKPYTVLQLVCSCLGKQYNIAEKIFYAAQYKDIQPYMKYVNEDTIPFIYDIQEILIRTYAEMRRG